MKGRAGGGGVGGVQTSPSNLPTRSLTDMRPELNPESQRFEARRRPQLFPLPTSEVLTEAFTFISSPGVALMETENLWERARLCVCVCVALERSPSTGAKCKHRRWMYSTGSSFTPSLSCLAYTSHRLAHWTHTLVLTHTHTHTQSLRCENKPPLSFPQVSTDESCISVLGCSADVAAITKT